MFLNCITVTLPEIVTDPMDDTIMLVTNNFNYSLTCEAFGAVSYDWERQSGSIPPNTAGVNTSTLTFINLTPQDAGSYRCVATNPSGSSASNYAQLAIQGKLMELQRENKQIRAYKLNKVKYTENVVYLINCSNLQWIESPKECRHGVITDLDL